MVNLFDSFLSLFALNRVIAFTRLIRKPKTTMRSGNPILLDPVDLSPQPPVFFLLILLRQRTGQDKEYDNICRKQGKDVIYMSSPLFCL